MQDSLRCRRYSGGRLRSKTEHCSCGIGSPLACLAQKVCGGGLGDNPPPWAKGFVGETLQDIAKHRTSGLSPADAICTSIPLWLSTLATNPIPGTTEINLNDICALAVGLYHFRDELEPSFVRHMGDVINADPCNAADIIRRDHNQFIDQVVRCFDEIHELTPLGRGIAQELVPLFAGLFFGKKRSFRTTFYRVSCLILPLRILLRRLDWPRQSYLHFLRRSCI